MYKDICLVNFSDNSVKVDLTKNLDYTLDKSNLIQRIIKLLLTEKGTNAFSKKFGSYFNSLISYSFFSDIETIKSNIFLLIQEIVNIIKNEQENEIFEGKEIPDYLLLDNIYINNIEFDESNLTLRINLLIVTKDQIKFPLVLNRGF